MYEGMINKKIIPIENAIKKYIEKVGNLYTIRED
jgi:hypothetical protein